MNDRIAEPIGFLCRWCLLMLTVAGVLVAMSTMVAAAGSMGDTAVTMAVGDFICQESSEKGVTLLGVPLGPMPAARPAMVLCTVSDSPVMLSRESRHWIAIVLPRRRPGRHTVRLVGVPYGVMASYSSDVLLHVLPPGRPNRVFLMDARLTQTIGAGEADAWRQAVAAMRSRGELAMFHGGSASELAEVRERVRGQYPQTPVMFDYREKPVAARVLRRAWQWLSATGRLDKPGPNVITADVRLAGWAARKGFAVCLISPGAKAGRNLKVFASVAALRDYLRSMRPDLSGGR